MTGNQAIETINEAFQKCIDDGWRFKGRLEAVLPQNQNVSVTRVYYEKGEVSNQRGFVEIFNLEARVEKQELKLNKPTAAMILESAIINDQVEIVKVSDTGEICKYCGGVDFRRMGTCLYCLNCGESAGCS